MLLSVIYLIYFIWGKRMHLGIEIIFYQHELCQIINTHIITRRIFGYTMTQRAWQLPHDMLKNMLKMEVRNTLYLNW